jgi:hypothetical protein
MMCYAGLKQSHKFIEMVSPTYNNCDVNDTSNLSYGEGRHGDNGFGAMNSLHCLN